MLKDPKSTFKLSARQDNALSQFTSRPQISNMMLLEQDKIITMSPNSIHNENQFNISKILADSRLNRFTLQFSQKLLTHIKP
jgi:hypothetical protein